MTNYLSLLNLLNAIILLFAVFACQPNQNEIQEINVLGDWSFIDYDKSYSEAYISLKKIVFYSEDQGHFSYRYFLRNDSILYGGESYKLDFINCNSTMIFSRNSDSIIMKRIVLGNTLKDTTYFDPYHLRRCNFLVMEGIITMEQAVSYIISLEEDAPTDTCESRMMISR